MSLRYAVVTPARNEEINLKRLGRAMIAQLHCPVVWVVVGLPALSHAHARLPTRRGAAGFGRSAGPSTDGRRASASSSMSRSRASVGASP